MNNKISCAEKKWIEKFNDSKKKKVTKNSFLFFTISSALF